MHKRNFGRFSLSHSIVGWSGPALFNGSFAWTTDSSVGLKRKMRMTFSAARILIGGLPRSTTPQSAVDLALNCPALTTAQVRSELLQLAALVAGCRPRHVLEIGTCNGGSLLIFARLADPEATLITIDFPGGRFGDEGQMLRPWVIPRLKEPGQKLHFLRLDSHLAATRDRVAGILGGEKLDLLFIDGDHSYEGVKQDFEMYSPFVKEGGIVAFHDILDHPAHPDAQVGRFWSEIKTHYRHQEFVENPAQGWAGIGVLFV
jgi:predicted O-methyltransferase YrrM